MQTKAGFLYMIAGMCKECGIVSAMFRDSCKEKGGFLITTGWIWCKKAILSTRFRDMASASTYRILTDCR